MTFTKMDNQKTALGNKDEVWRRNGKVINASSKVRIKCKCREE